MVMIDHGCTYDISSNQSMYPSSQADFLAKCKIIKEKMESKESEVSGRWYTEEAMRKEGKWTKGEIKSITQYCRRFPESLCRCTCEYVWVGPYQPCTYFVPYGIHKYQKETGLTCLDIINPLQVYIHTCTQAYI